MQNNGQKESESTKQVSDEERPTQTLNIEVRKDTSTEKSSNKIDDSHQLETTQKLQNNGQKESESTKQVSDEERPNQTQNKTEIIKQLIVSAKTSFMKDIWY
mgnify:CR=1 FL=1